MFAPKPFSNYLFLFAIAFDFSELNAETGGMPDGPATLL